LNGLKYVLFIEIMLQNFSEQAGSFTVISYETIIHDCF